MESCIENGFKKSQTPVNKILNDNLIENGTKDMMDGEFTEEECNLSDGCMYKVAHICY